MNGNHTRVHLTLVHGSSGHGRHWAPVVAELPAHWAVRCPTLCGYDNPASFDTRAPYGMRDELRRVVDSTARPAGLQVLVGHSLGGLIAMAAHLTHPGRFDALLLIEPVLFGLLARRGYERTQRDVKDFFAGYVARVRIGQRIEAAQSFFEFWQMHEAWAAMPPARRERLAATMPKVARECELIDAPAIDNSRIAAMVRLPVLLLGGSASPAHIHRVHDALLEMHPWMRRAEIAGAGHMSPLTHAASVARHVVRFVEALPIRREREAALSA